MQTLRKQRYQLRNFHGKNQSAADNSSILCPVPLDIFAQKSKRRDLTKVLLQKKNLINILS